MTLPVIMTILDIYPLKRLNRTTGWFSKEARKVWFEKIPFYLLALPATWMAGYAQIRNGAASSIHAVGFLERLALTCYGPAFYIWKTVRPFHLLPIYELPVHFHFMDLSYLGSVLFVLVLSVSFFLLRRRWPAFLTVWAYYCVILLPICGIFQSGPHRTADRISYLSCLGWAALAGAGIFLWWRMLEKRKQNKQILWVGVGIGLILVGLTFLTRQQCRVWHDSRTLWTYAMEWIPDSYEVQNSMGDTLYEDGDLNGAIPYFQRAVELKPGRYEAYFNLGLTLFKQGRWNESIENFQRSMEMKGNVANVQLTNPQAQSCMAYAFLKLGNVDEAIRHFQECTRLDSQNYVAQSYLGMLLAQQGRLDEAAQRFREALELQPSNADAHYNLGGVLMAQGQTDQAIQCFEKVLQLNPAFTEARLKLEAARRRNGTPKIGNIK
jgi:tetratricopeptide (TPR) repeat protein